MEVIINGKNYFFTKEDLDRMYIDEGQEGVCYRVKDYKNDFVIKIFKKDTHRDLLPEIDLKQLIAIETQRILMPKGVVYSKNGDYIGYTSDFIQYKRPRIRNLKIGEFRKEIDLLDDDCKLLSKKNVSLSDLNINNTIFSNGIYFLDVGGFRISENDRFLTSLNNEDMRIYQLESILFQLFKFNKKEQDIIRKNLRDFESLSDYIMYFDSPDENVKTFFKTRI